jgi:hypothetical protein
MMALREKLREQTQPLLEPGETTAQVFLAQEGRGWMVGLGGGLLMMLFAKPRIVVVTDRAIVVFRQNKLIATPKEVLVRLPRNTYFGPVRGRWAKVALIGEHEQIYVHRRFHGDVRSADAELTETSEHSSGEPEEVKSPDVDI